MNEKEIREAVNLMRKAGYTDQEIEEELEINLTPTPEEEEKAALAKKKHLEKMRKGAAKAREKKAKKKEQTKDAYRQWLKEEKDAYLVYIEDRSNENNRRAWQHILKEMPRFEDTPNNSISDDDA